MKPGVVWFKRDLRVFDHAPLVEAVRHREVLPLYVYEPELIRAPDCSVPHIRFLNECLLDLDQALSARGSPLVVQFGEITHIFKRVLETFGPFVLYSHDEAGNAISHERDRRVAAWCAAQGIEWISFPVDGMPAQPENQTGHDDSASGWLQYMRQPALPAPDFIRPPKQQLLPSGTLKPSSMGMQGSDKPQRAKGGRKAALQLVRQFFNGWLHPSLAAQSGANNHAGSGTRLSPYVALGTVSVRELVHRTWKARRELPAVQPGHPASQVPEISVASAAMAAFADFERRLQLRCHSIRQLASDPGLAQVHASRRDAGDDEAFRHWCEGQTGDAQVDEAMAALTSTGWIDYPTRARVVRHAIDAMVLDWQDVALFLAREFIDYEPGIHYLQLRALAGLYDLMPLPEAAPAIDEPVVAEPVVAEPVVAEPVGAEPVLAKPAVAEPIRAEPGPDTPGDGTPAPVQETAVAATASDAAANPTVATAATAVPDAISLAKAKPAGPKPTPPQLSLGFD